MGLDGQGRCGFLLLGNVDPSLLHGAPVGRRLVPLTLYQASVVLLHPNNRCACLVFGIHIPLPSFQWVVMKCARFIDV